MTGLGLLAMAGTAIEGGERRLQGGRYIGAIERLLIFGLAAAGEPTAAALVVSAKSILRFPELSRAARREDLRDAGGMPAGDDDRPITADVDVIPEYFLLGSLVSWALALALAPALLVAGP